MNDHQIATARKCLEAAEQNTMKFPQIVGTLMEAGFESYAVDFRRAMATYCLANGETVDLPTHRVAVPIGAIFEIEVIQSAIRDAQQDAPGYTYIGFCDRVAAAGCAGYVVSFLGRRALYIGRTAETHVEHFPG